MVVIKRVGNKIFKEGRKVRVRYPSMTSGYIQYTCNSIACGKALINDIGNNWQRRRAKLIKL